MAKTTINKNQLDPLEIVNADINASAAIATSKLAEGAEFIQRDGSVNFTGNQSMNNFKLTNLGAPSNPDDAVRLVDLQNNQAGLSSKEAVRAATTLNITLSGVQTIDGIALVAGDRVLVKNQTTASANGIYEVAAGAWPRTSDADASSELKSGTYVFVQEGATQADSGWILSTDGAITVGTTALVWVQFTGLGQIDAGAGLSKTGNTLNVGTASSARIVVNADNIDLATVVTAGTGIKTTYDAYGRITASAGLAVGDLPTHNHTWGQITGVPTSFTPSAHTLASHSDVTITSNTTGEILKWNGTAWVNNTLAEAGIEPAFTKNTGFNKAFGTTAGTVSEGNHTHAYSALTGIPATFAPSAHTLESHSNVTITSNTAGEILKWSGTAWINNTLAEAGIQAYDANLANLAALSTTGILVSTGADTNTTRTIAGTATRISVTNGDGIAGNPTIDLIATAVSPGTYSSVTVDTYGRVTAGSNSGTAASDKYIVRETPAGLVNGANGTFTLANTPVAGKEMVFLNGQLLEPGAGNDYTISGNTITILAPVPVAGDLLRVTYFAQ